MATRLEGIKVLSQWHRPSFEACLDVGKSYDLEITELDYRLNPGIAYQANGVTIKHFPRLHIIDGAIGYRLEWNGRFESGASNARGYRFVYDRRTTDPEPLTPHKNSPQAHDEERTGGASGQE